MGITILRRRRGSEQDGPRGRGVSPPGLFVFVAFTAAGVGAAVLMNQPGPAIVGALIGIYFLFAIQVAEQWEKAAVLRLGRYRGLRGPGPFVIIPVIDSVSTGQFTANANGHCHIHDTVTLPDPCMAPIVFIAILFAMLFWAGTKPSLLLLAASLYIVDERRLGLGRERQHPGHHGLREEEHRHVRVRPVLPGRLRPVPAGADRQVRPERQDLRPAAAGCSRQLFQRRPQAAAQPLKAARCVAGDRGLRVELT